MAQPIKYKTTANFLFNAGIDAIDQVLFRMRPDAKFAFVSLEDDGYKRGVVTCLLFEKMPDCVSLSIHRPENFTEIMEEMAWLNPLISWEVEETSSDAIYYLRLIKIPLQVNSDGCLHY